MQYTSAFSCPFCILLLESSAIEDNMSNTISLCTRPLVLVCECQYELLVFNMLSEYFTVEFAV